MNQIEAKGEERGQPALPARLGLEQADEESSEEGTQGEDRCRLALVRGDESTNRENSGTRDHESPRNSLGGRAT